MIRPFAALLAFALLIAMPLRAQQIDSARAGVSPVSASRTDSAPAALVPDPLSSKPPVSPTHALLESLFVPGWGQASLHRSVAGTIFTVVEAMSVAMVIESKKELADARRFGADSIVDHYDPPTQPGGAPTPVYQPNQYAARIKPRRQAVEDWVALLIFNHLVAGADAFVAAHLWDVPVEVSPRPSEQRVSVTVRVGW
ncbi:MAG TPA: hypothetical protein VF166_05490 [Gemmatimonadaceae bacterium]